MVRLFEIDDDGDKKPSPLLILLIILFIENRINLLEKLDEKDNLSVGQTIDYLICGDIGPD